MQGRNLFVQEYSVNNYSNFIISFKANLMRSNNICLLLKSFLLVHQHHFYFTKWQSLLQLGFCTVALGYGNISCRVFKRGVLKLERFVPQNHHTLRKLLTYKVSFLCQKSLELFSNSFSLKDINLGAHCLLLTLFDNINFSTPLLLKLGQIFDRGG